MLTGLNAAGLTPEEVVGKLSEIGRNLYRADQHMVAVYADTMTMRFVAITDKWDFGWGMCVLHNNPAIAPFFFLVESESWPAETAKLGAGEAAVYLTEGAEMGVGPSIIDDLLCIAEEAREGMKTGIPTAEASALQTYLRCMRCMQDLLDSRLVPVETKE